MKKKNIPQDRSAITSFSKELCYAVDESGNYTTDLSTGWEVKSTALDLAWTDIKKRVEKAKQQVLKGEISPVFYYMEKKVMDLEILSAYTGYWKWTIKRHFSPKNFKNLSQKRLNKYAEVFEISVEQLKDITLS